MTDVRALLKAKREEQRISHPYATYTSAGQLRCIACDMSVKQASAWNGHVGSKAHRTNVARLKEEERVREEQRKRKAEEMDNAAEAAEMKRRKLEEKGDDESEDDDDDDDKGNIYTNANGGGEGFPADFFSDPKRTLPTFDRDSDNEQESKTLPASSEQSQHPPLEIDLEWAKFQETVIHSRTVEEVERDKFAHATITAEPELVTEIPEGFPSSVVQGADAAPAPEAPKDEAEERRRKAEEEKEHIMDRLLDEERAQEEADERVSLLKARLDIAKRRRMLAKTQKTEKRDK